MQVVEAFVIFKISGNDDYGVSDEMNVAWQYCISWKQINGTSHASYLYLCNHASESQEFHLGPHNFSVAMPRRQPERQ